MQLSWKKTRQATTLALSPSFPGCHTQAKTIDELIKRIKEAIELYLECEGNQPKDRIDIVGLQFVEVSAE